jgi:hypothetical protein
MSKICYEIHKELNKLTRYNFTSQIAHIPLNGLYVLFEKGETAHGFDRIVRFGTHRKKDNLKETVKDIFYNKKKDRNIFVKNIGRALLSLNSDPYLDIWNIDMTRMSNKLKYEHLIDSDHQNNIEEKVMHYVQNNITLAVLQIEDFNSRLSILPKLISTISICKECYPSINWLGLHSPVDKIKSSGLWQINKLYKEQLTMEELKTFMNLFDNYS